MFSTMGAYACGPIVYVFIYVMHFQNNKFLLNVMENGTPRLLTAALHLFRVVLELIQ